MVKLNKKRKTKEKTYFYIPLARTLYLERLMNESNENHYRLLLAKDARHLIPKDQQIETLQYFDDEPDYIDTEPWVCISNYPTKYLRKILEQFVEDPDQFAKAIELSRAIAALPPEEREG